MSETKPKNIKRLVTVSISHDWLRRPSTHSSSRAFVHSCIRRITCQGYLAYTWYTTCDALLAPYQRTLENPTWCGCMAHDHKRAYIFVFVHLNLCLCMVIGCTSKSKKRLPSRPAKALACTISLGCGMLRADFACLASVSVLIRSSFAWLAWAAIVTFERQKRTACMLSNAIPILQHSYICKPQPFEHHEMRSTKSMACEV